MRACDARRSLARLPCSAVVGIPTVEEGSSRMAGVVSDRDMHHGDIARIVRSLQEWYDLGE